MDISVVGTTSVTLPAECVVVTLSLSFTGPDRDTVARDTAQLAERVKAELDAVVADDGGSDARLSALRTWTNIPYDSEGKPGQPQHVSQVRGSVTIKDLTRVGPFLGSLATTEGVQVEGLNWKLFEATMLKLQPEVLAGAFEDAFRRAQWIAEAAGRSVLEVSSIEDNGAPTYGFARGKMAMAMADGAPSFDLDPEDVEVTATLGVKFAARRPGE